MYFNIVFSFQIELDDLDSFFLANVLCGSRLCASFVSPFSRYTWLQIKFTKKTYFDIKDTKLRRFQIKLPQTRKVVDTHVEAWIRGVIGLLIWRRPEINEANMFENAILKTRSLGAPPGPDF